MRRATALHLESTMADLLFDTTLGICCKMDFLETALYEAQSIGTVGLRVDTLLEDNARNIPERFF
jgi:hypothetical protein